MNLRRLLRHDASEAERILNPPLLEIKSFSETMTEEMKEVIFRVRQGGGDMAPSQNLFNSEAPVAACEQKGPA